MKLLAYFLLLTNIAFVLWQYKTGAFIDNNTQLSEVSDRKAKQILLLSEVEIKEDDTTDKLLIAQIPKETQIPDQEQVKKQTQVPSQVLEADPVKEQAQVLNQALEPDKGREQISINQLQEQKQSPELEPVAAVNSAKISSPDLEKDTDIKPSIEKVVEKPQPEEKAKKQKEAKAEPDQKSQLVSIEKEPEFICSQVGVFTSNKSYTAWLKKLTTLQTTIIASYKQPVERQSYLLYYPAAKSFAASKENVKMLKKKGIKDLWLFLKGADRGKISIGLYSYKASAEKIQKRLKTKGIHTKINARKLKAQQYKLQLKTKKQNQTKLYNEFMRFKKQYNSSLNFKRLDQCFKQ